MPFRYYNEKKYHELVQKDEFHIIQEKKGKSNLCCCFIRIFVLSVDDLYSEFKEAVINFPPTYNIELRSNGDTYDKHRIPAYTVRIKMMI